MNTYTTFLYKCEDCKKKSWTGEPRCNRYGPKTVTENFYVLPKLIVLTMCFLLSSSNKELQNYLEDRQCGQNISEFDEEGHSILHELSEKKLYEKIEILINQGINFKVKVNGENIAHVAARKGDVALIRLIRENNATRFKSPFYESNDCGETPLLVAILHQHQDAIEVLMNHYLDPIGLEAEGNSLLHYATKFNSIHVIRRLGCHYSMHAQHLFKKSAADGLNPLHYATKGNFLEIVAWLLDSGAKDTKKDDKGYLAIHHIQSPEMLNLFSDFGINFNRPSRTGETLLSLSVKDNNVPLIQAVVSKNANY